MRPHKIPGGAPYVTASKEELDGLFTGNESAQSKVINAFIDSELIETAG
jgi:hypothetical protein